MRQNTSATITCHVSPVEVLTEAADVGITIYQDSTGVGYTFTKSFNAVVIDGEAGTATCYLGADQTASFDVGPALVQVTGKTLNNNRWASSIAKINVYRTLPGGV